MSPAFGADNILIHPSLVSGVSTAPGFGVDELIAVGVCGKLIRVAAGHHGNPFDSIPTGQSRLFSAILLEDQKTGPEIHDHFFVTRSLIGGHAALIKVATKRYGPVRSKWAGEVDVSRIELPNSDRVVAKLSRGNCVAGQWKIWLDQLAGVKVDRPSQLQPGLNHENSIVYFDAYLHDHRPDLRSSNTDLRPFDPLCREPHLSDELNRLSVLLSAYQKSQGAQYSEGSVIHDIRGALGNLTSSIDLIKSLHHAPVIDLSTINELLNIVEEAAPVTLAYLNIVQTQYPADKLLHTARAMLRNIGGLPRGAKLSIPQLNQLSNLGEVVEFVNEMDESAVGEIPNVDPSIPPYFLHSKEPVESAVSGTSLTIPPPIVRPATRPPLIN